MTDISMTAIRDLTCVQFVDLLASKQPVPGGGGASALCGAIGTALGHMVGSLTLGKKKYADVEDEIRSLIKRCDRLQEELLELADEDAKVFAPLAKAYGLPSQTEEEKQYKTQILEQCCRDACMVPLQIMRKCCDGITLAEVFAEKGSRLAVSDAGCAAAVLEGALKAASLNVFINTKSMQDREFAEKTNAQALDMLRFYGAKASTIFLTVQQSFFTER